MENAYLNIQAATSLNIIDLLTNNPKISLVDLIDTIEITKKTLLSYLEQINVDLHDNDINKKILVSDEKFVIADLDVEDYLLMRRYYAERSIMLKVFFFSMFKKYNSVNDMSEQEYISEATLWRAIKTVNRKISVYNLKITTRNGLHIAGTMLNAILISSILLYSYYMEVPSYMDAYNEGLLLEAKVLSNISNIYPKEDYKKRLFFSLVLFVTRNTLRKQPELTYQHNLRFPLYSGAEVETLVKFLPDDKEKHKKIIAKYLISFFISYFPYSSTDKLPNLEWMSTTGFGLSIVKSHNILMQSLNQKLIRPMDTEDFEKVSISALLTSYRSLMIDNNNVLAELGNIDPVHKSLIQKHPLAITKISNQVSSIPAKMGIGLFKTKEFYLVPALTNSFLEVVDTKKYLPEIKVMLFSNSSPQLQKDLIAISGLTTLYNIKFSKNNSEKVDLIIADSLIPEELTYFNKSKIFYWHFEPTERDITLLNEQLIEISEIIKLDKYSSTDHN